MSRNRAAASRWCKFRMEAVWAVAAAPPTTPIALSAAQQRSPSVTPPLSSPLLLLAAPTTAKLSLSLVSHLPSRPSPSPGFPAPPLLALSDPMPPVVASFLLSASLPTLLLPLFPPPLVSARLLLLTRQHQLSSPSPALSPLPYLADGERVSLLLFPSPLALARAKVGLLSSSECSAASSGDGK